MNKLAYINYTSKKTNRKIWDSLMGKYKLLKKENTTLAYLWFPFACIIFGFVGIFSWISFFTLLFKNIRFTPHYLKASIDISGMNLDEIIQYLDFQYSDYKNRLSYGNIPSAKQKQIEATFDILYDQYKRPESDKKHIEIISNFSTLHQSLQTIGEETNRDLSDIKQETTSIYEYTNKKLAEEKELEERKLEKDQKETSKYNREKGRNLDSFESALSDKQVGILVKYCNQIPTFNIDITQAQMKAILQCTHTKPLQTTVNKYIALLFTRLYEEKLICETWKSVATKERCFLSAKGKELNAKDLSSANSTSGIIKPQIYDLIEECIDKIKEA